MSIHRDNLARTLPQTQPAPIQTPHPHRAPARTPEQKALAREKLLWLGTILVCVAILLGLVGRYASMVAVNYEIKEQQVAFSKLREEQMRLEMQVLELESADRIKDFAANKLNMKQVDESNFVVLPGSKR